MEGSGEVGNERIGSRIPPIFEFRDQELFTAMNINRAKKKRGRSHQVNEADGGLDACACTPIQK